MTGPGPPARSWFARTYRVLLLTFPKAHRRAYGREMMDVFLESERRATSRRARTALYARSLLDALSQGLATRWDHLRRGRTVRARRSTDTRRASVPRRDGMSGWVQDLGFGLRQLIRRPVTAAVAVLTLAIGVGGNLLLLAVVDAVLLRPLPFGDPERVVLLSREFEGEEGIATLAAYSEPAFVALREGNRAFDAITAFTSGSVAAGGAERPFSAAFTAATAELWDVVDVSAVAGRTFDSADDDPGAAPVVVISDRLWSRRYQRDPNVVGRTLEVGGRSRTVVGVAPPGFSFPADHVDLYLPLVIDPARWADDAVVNNNRRLAARLSERALPDPGPELEATTRAAIALRNDAFRDNEVTRVVPYREATVGSVRSTLYLLMGAVVFVLLIACANLAGLMLVRAEDRRGEFAVRASLGAGRWRIVRQLLVESLLLSLLGTVAGAALALVGLPQVQALAPGSVPGLDAASLSPFVLAGAALLAIGTGVLFGLAPAVVFARMDVRGPLSGAGRGSVGGGTRIRSTLVVAQVAITTVLLVGAGLMVGSLLRLQDEDIGFRLDGRLTSRLLVPPSGETSDQEFHVRFGRLTAAAEAIPGVERSAFVLFLPMRASSNWFVEAEFRTDADIRFADYNLVTPGYFETLGIPVLEGRSFDAAETAGRRPAVVISSSLAHELFPAESAVGKRINVDMPPGRVWREVVGVVGDVRASAPSAAPTLQMYFPPIELPFASPGFGGTLVLQTRLAAGTLAGPLRRAIADVEPTVPVADLVPLAEVVARAEGERRFVTALLLAFAGAGLLLCVVGLYGVLSHAIASRTREMGLRLAVGASPRALVALVLRQALTLWGIGGGLGLLGAMALTGLLRSLLYEVRPLDPGTLVVVSATLAAVALATAAGPGWRASRADPVRALSGD